ncbi:Hypothetical predicted protein [Pelobates cultripes]|uniref:Uncharacterized protein n=1 Tax=Pelobates cultripes TaxID=61616 RepID=A0AAD1VZZ4_PELCU|nr:Hypothetical predicted protein [Pelobates cultripes]
MSQARSKQKLPDKGEKSSFFGTRPQQPKQAASHESDQDGDGDDTMPLHADPVGNLPVTQEILQKCLDAMSNKLLDNLNKSIAEIKKDLRDLGERTARAENKMDEFAEAHNDMADHVQRLEHQQHQLQVKIMDIEDRSRRQTIRLRGIPEERREYKDITETLRARQVPYRWGHLVHLLNQRNGTVTTILSPGEGRKTLRTWGIALQQQPEKTQATKRLSPEWKKQRK